MERIMIYPYTRAYEPYVRYAGLLENREIVSLVSSGGSGLVGRQVCSGEKELTVSKDYEAELNRCDGVWFVNDEKFALPEDAVEEKIRKAVLQGKKILCTRTSFRDSARIADSIPSELQMLPQEPDLKKDMLGAEYCYHIDTPVLVVYGTERDTDKLAVQLALREELMRIGYKVASISSRMDGRLYGMYPIPEYMLKPVCAEGDKIRKYNHYVKQIELTQQPEIMVIGIPGGVLPYDRVDHNEYGILAYEMSFAVPCDGAIVCMPYNARFDGDYSEFARDMERIFRYRTIGCHIAAAVPDMQTALDNRKRHLVSLDRKFVETKVKQYARKDVFHIVSKDEAPGCVQFIVDALSEG